MDSINVRDVPDLERVADEVRRTGRPRVLRRDSEKLAIVMPVHDHDTPTILDDPHRIWSGYDPDRVRAAFAATMGSWRDLDTDKMIADLYRAREEGSRPVDRP
ncbi:MAG: hypothetical protein EPO26_00085 [Chloroflexota bacterium]|nr:MAG: hypothetical protein EPO26_00085 [Chloroflexota bacterium]